MNNNAIFNAVLAGVTGGGQERWITSQSAASYAAYSATVLAIATGIDSLIAPTAVGDAQARLMSSICASVFAGRFPTNADPNIAASIVALYTAQAPNLLSEGGAGGVTSWDSRVGAVVPLNGDYAASLVTNDSSVVGATVKDALNTINTAGFGVSSFNSRTGAVLPASGDYTSGQITNASTVTGATVTAALNTLKAASGVTSWKTRTGAVVPASGDYSASQVNNDSSVAGAAVSDALNTLNTGLSNLVVNPFRATFYVNAAFAGTSTGSESNPYTSIAAAFAAAVALAVGSAIIYIPPNANHVENVVFPTTGGWEIASALDIVTPTSATITGTIDVSSAATAQRVLTNITVVGAISGLASAGGNSRLLIRGTGTVQAITLTGSGASAWHLILSAQPGNGILSFCTGNLAIKGDIIADGYSITSATIAVSVSSTFIGCTTNAVAFTGNGGAIILKMYRMFTSPWTINAASGSVQVIMDGVSATNFMVQGLTTVGGTVTSSTQNSNNAVLNTVANNVAATTLANITPKSFMVAEAELTVLSSGTLGASCGLNIIYTDLTGTLVTRALTPLLDITSGVGTKVSAVLPFAQNGATAVQYSLTGVGTPGALSLAVAISVRLAN
jgi:hypothetical protein